MNTNAPRSGCLFLAMTLVATAVAVLPDTTSAQRVINAPPEVIDSSFDLKSGETLNVAAGGVVRSGFDANEGSIVNISGGMIGSSFEGHAGSQVNISGGTLGRRFKVYPGSDVDLIGGEFRLNGEAHMSSTISLVEEDIFTGTFADGSSFIFTPLNFDEISGVKLTTTALPSYDLSPIVVNASTIDAPNGLRAGQSLNLQEGGELQDNFSLVGSSMSISGGKVGEYLESYESTVGISGGVVTSINSYQGSVLNISGGHVSSIRSLADSSVNLSGGTLFYLDARSGSKAVISGGTLFGGIQTDEESEIELIGGDFRLNGKAYTGTNITTSENDVFSGTLADGSTFIFTKGTASYLDLRLTSAVLPSYDLTPLVVNSSITERFKGLRAGQTLTLKEGGELLNDFSVIGATLNIQGGESFGWMKLTNSRMNMSDGILRNHIQLLENNEVKITGGWITSGISVSSSSVVDISGGYFRNYGSLVVIPFIAKSGSVTNISGGDFATVNGNVSITFQANADSVVNISGGSFGLFSSVTGSNSAFVAERDSEVNISGGDFGNNFTTSGRTNISGGNFGHDFSIGGTVNISGGLFLGKINLYEGGTLNLYATDFLLNNAPLPNLEPGDIFSISEPSNLVSATFIDGSSFSFFDAGFVRFGIGVGTLNLHLLTGLEGDYNNDGIVDAADYTVWRDNLGSTFSMPNETVTPGVVTKEDYEVYANNYGAQYESSEPANISIPEPASIALLLLGCCSLIKWAKLA